MTCLPSQEISDSELRAHIQYIYDAFITPALAKIELLESALKPFANAALYSSDVSHSADSDCLYISMQSDDDNEDGFTIDIPCSGGNKPDVLRVQDLRRAYVVLFGEPAPFVLDEPEDEEDIEE